MSISILSGQQENKATQIVVSLIEHYDSFDNISAKFTYQERMKYSAESTNEILGFITMQKNLYVVSIPNLELRFDGKYLYTISSENKEVFRSENTGEEYIPFHLFNLLSYLQENYVASMDIIQNFQDQRLQFINLEPTATAGNIESVLLGINTDSDELVSITMESTAQQLTQITFSDYTYNRGLTSDFFAFQRENYPGYIIIE